MNTRRQEQVNELIRSELAQLFTKELELPHGVIVTISHVETSADMEHARVYLSIWPVERRGEIWPTLVPQQGHFQRLLNRRLHMDHVPLIEFMHDESEEKAERLNRLLDTLDG